MFFLNDTRGPFGGEILPFFMRTSLPSPALQHRSFEKSCPCYEARLNIPRAAFGSRATLFVGVDKLQPL